MNKILDKIKYYLLFASIHIIIFTITYSASKSYIDTEWFPVIMSFASVILSFRLADLITRYTIKFKIT